MNLSTFKQLVCLTDKELRQKVCNIELDLFKLQFKKTTGQVFKRHEIKFKKRLLAQLYTLVRRRDHYHVQTLVVSRIEDELEVEFAKLCEDN